MSTALVLGVNGQDGSYLAEALLRRGITVVGVGRNPASRYVQPHPDFEYRQLDIRASADLVALVTMLNPDFAFHMAAVHGAVGAGFTYEASWRDMMLVNVHALHVLLEHARSNSPDMRVIYAGSAKIFPNPLVGTINEDTPVQATCLYSIGKIAARSLIFEYRRSHGVRATNLILFNHDSVRRGEEYFLPRIASTLCAAKLDSAHKARFRTLDFFIDWSAADELMEQAADLALASDGMEFVMASGRTVDARSVVEEFFRKHGLEAGVHIEEEVRSVRPPMFNVDVRRLHEATTCRAVKTPEDILDAMVAHRRSLNTGRE